VDTGENRPMTDIEAGAEIMTRLPEQSLEVIKGCHRSKQNKYIYFSLRPGILKIQSQPLMDIKY
jgi:hypothetical protein